MKPRIWPALLACFLLGLSAPGRAQSPSVPSLSDAGAADAASDATWVDAATSDDAAASARPDAAVAPPPLSSPLTPAAAEDADALLEQGNQAYLHGDFKTAIDAYEQLVSLGIVHEDLYYVLGNAYAKADRLGPAILNYERALALDPDQEDARANLQLCRDSVSRRWQDKLVNPSADPLWMRALALFTAGDLTLLFLGLYVVLFGLALLVYLLPSGFARVAAAALLIFAIVGTAGAGTLLAGRWWLVHQAEFGIALPDELAVKEGPDAAYQTSFLIHAGLRVRVVEKEQDWLHVRLANGLEGWVRDRDVGRL